MPNRPGDGRRIRPDVVACGRGGDGHGCGVASLVDGVDRIAEGGGADPDVVVVADGVRRQADPFVDVRRRDDAFAPHDDDVVDVAVIDAGPREIDRAPIAGRSEPADGRRWCRVELRGHVCHGPAAEVPVTVDGEDRVGVRRVGAKVAIGDGVARGLQSCDADARLRGGRGPCADLAADDDGGQVLGPRIGPREPGGRLGRGRLHRRDGTRRRVIRRGHAGLARCEQRECRCGRGSDQPGRCRFHEGSSCAMWTGFR
jgi:hypothetical protein